MVEARAGLDRTRALDRPQTGRLDAVFGDVARPRQRQRITPESRRRRASTPSRTSRSGSSFIVANLPSSRTPRASGDRIGSGPTRVVGVSEQETAPMRTDFQFTARRAAVATALAFALACAAPYAFAAGGGGVAAGVAAAVAAAGAARRGWRRRRRRRPPDDRGPDHVSQGPHLGRQGASLPDHAQRCPASTARWSNTPMCSPRPSAFEEALQTLDPAAEPLHPARAQLSRLRDAQAGRTDEGIGYYLQSVAMDLNYAQVREYLGEAYVI